jgi:hypothetical protein
MLGVAALALALAGVAAADTTGSVVTLYPVSHGAFAHANWQAQAGRPDSQGDGNQAFVLEAPGTPDTSAAGIVRGFEGVRIRELASLAYEHRLGGTCTKTDPRWTLFIRGRSAKRYLVNLGCAVTPARPTGDPQWVQRVFTQGVIHAEIVRQISGSVAEADALNGSVDELALVVDRSKGPAYLDNIAVRSRLLSKVWTFAGDNGNGVPGTPVDFSAEDLALLAAPLPAEALWDEADVLASITPEEQALIDQANAATD